MSLFINNGLSGLLASQRALETISNNVANASTDGYVRQQANLVENISRYRGGFTMGTGVHVDSIERVYDRFLGNEVKITTMSQSRAQSYNDLAMRLDGLLGDPDLNISTSIQRFFDQLEAVNRDPTSTVNREQLLAEGDALQSRFGQISTQINGISNEIDNRMQSAVNSINDIVAGLADINDRIGGAPGGPPNDLLDEQERLLTQLAQQIDFTEIRQANGMTNIMIGSGQPLVLDDRSFELAVVRDEFDASRLQLAYNDGSGLQMISNRISGGAIAGMLGFRNETLSAVGRELGQIALGLTETFNAQHALGGDLNGQRGANFFRALSPMASASSRNTGTATVSLDYGDTAAVNAKDYRLLFDGTNWQLNDAFTGAQVTMTGSGTVGDPFVAEGMEIVIGAGAAAGDRFLLQPVSHAAGSFRTNIVDPSKIAVASMLTSAAALQNTGNATVSGAEVTDPTAPGLLQSVKIVFDNSTTFRIYDNLGSDLSGPLAYTSGADISFNGWAVQVTGAPLAGDQFAVTQSAAGSGDNTNGQALVTLPSKGFFSNGRLSVEGLGASMLTSIGSAAVRSGQDLVVQNSLRDQAEMDMQSLSGVNLEEEAANLLRYQEAYLAASKVISVANDLFQTLLGVIGR